MLRKSIYRGWYVVGAAFITYMVVWGGIWYSFSVFYSIFVSEFSWGKGEVAGVFSLSIILVFVSGPFVGALLDRYGPRKVLPGAALLLGASLLLCGQVKSLSGLYLFYGVGCGTGMSFLLFTAQTALLSRWFEAYRGTALGVALSGAGLGMMIFVPLIQFITERMGVSGGFLFLSVLVLLLVLPVNCFLVRLPLEGERDLESGLPIGVGSAQSRYTYLVENPDWASNVWTIRQALRTKRFWLMCLAGITGTAFVVQTTFSHYILMAKAAGYQAALASKMLGLSGIAGTLGFLFWGRISDRVGREWAFTLGSLCLIAGLLSYLAMEQAGRLAPFLSFAVLFGFGYGSRAPLMQSIWADMFQGPYFSSIFGMYQMFLAVGMTGPWIVGGIVEDMGSYRPIVWFLVISLTLSTLLVWVASPRHVRRVSRRVV